MSLVSGMRTEAAEWIHLARAVWPFVDVAHLARRAALDRHDLTVLAHAGALRSLAKGHRRNAIWTAAAAVPDKDILRGTELDDEAPALPQASEGSEIVTDYRAMGFTLGRHPRELAQLRNGQFARMRDRDGTSAPGHSKGRAVHHARRRDGADQRESGQPCLRSTVGRRLARRCLRFMGSGRPVVPPRINGCSR